MAVIFRGESNLPPLSSHDRLSWGLLYAALVTVMSILMSVIATYTALFPNSDFFVIFLLIFLYGISSVSRERLRRAPCRVPSDL